MNARDRSRHWTRDRFLAWLTETGVPVMVQPFALAPCACGESNCHGWRLVPPAVAETGERNAPER
jgi:hypothetical protein